MNKIVLFFILLIGFISCKPETCEEIIPAIRFVSFEQYTDNKAKLTFYFKDCDGNIGLEQTDTTDDNLELTYYYFQRGDWVLLTKNDSTNEPLEINYRIPILETNEEITGEETLEGEIDIDIDRYRRTIGTDTIKYSIILYDQDRNESNRIETPTIIAF